MRYEVESSPIATAPEVEIGDWDALDSVWIATPAPLQEYVNSSGVFDCDQEAEAGGSVDRAGAPQLRPLSGDDEPIQPGALEGHGRRGQGDKGRR